MSYILEALKKSKQERQNGETPNLHIVHGVPSLQPRPSRFNRVKMSLGGLAILLGVFAGAYFIFSDEKSTEYVTSSKTIKVREIEIHPQFYEQAEEGSVVVQNHNFMPPVPSFSEEPLQVILIGRTSTKKVFIHSQEKNRTSVSEEFVLIKNRNELPLVVQEELPELVFAGHTYADDPKQRMIIVNNAILREGDSIDSNTKLVEIIWEGVVLEYNGIVFKQEIH